jgi:beta-lactam-binding protein with PASTA domain
MIIDILIFIAGVIGGALITLNNTRKVRAIANKLEEEAQELREKVEKEVKSRRKPKTKTAKKQVRTTPPRV